MSRRSLSASCSRPVSSFLRFWLVFIWPLGLASSLIFSKRGFCENTKSWEQSWGPMKASTVDAAAFGNSRISSATSGNVRLGACRNCSAYRPSFVSFEKREKQRRDLYVRFKRSTRYIFCKKKHHFSWKKSAVFLERTGGQLDPLPASVGDRSVRVL